jgi:hypothetical protein
VAVKRGCPECLTEGYRRDGEPMGTLPGYVAHEADGAVTWRPCWTCNRDRWSAWQTGEMEPATPAEDLRDRQGSRGPSDDVREVWRTMLAPKPSVPADNESVEEKARRRAQLERLAKAFANPEQEEP